MFRYELELNIFDKNKSKSPIANFLYAFANMFLYVFMLFLVGLLLLVSFVSLCGISGDSMEGTLHDGQNVLLLNTKNVKKGDVIVFNHGNSALIKRVIATGGESLIFVGDDNDDVGVYILKGSTYKKLKEDYIFSTPDPMRTDWFDRCIYKPIRMERLEEAFDESLIDDELAIKIPKGQLFVMGDNREHSSDSRAIGPIEQSKIVGKMIYNIEQNSFIENVLLFIYGQNQSIRGLL